MALGMMSDVIMSILMLAGMLLTIGGLYLLYRRRATKQGILMLVAALVTFANVAIWAMPAPRAVQGR